MTMQREAIDFLTVAPEHRAIDERLVNWARWVKGGRRVGGVCAPMFRLYRSSDVRSAEPRSAGATPDELDGLDIERAVAVLPEAPREAVRWHYCFAFVSPGKVARYLDVRMNELPALVAEARGLLVAARV